MRTDWLIHGACLIATAVAVALKLLGIIAWPWFWVLSPMCIPGVLMALVGLLTLTINLLAELPWSRR